MRKIAIWIVLAGFIASALLGGCGQDSETEQTPPPQQPAQQDEQNGAESVDKTANPLEAPPVPDDATADTPTRVDAAVERGLDWLLTKQDADGLWLDTGNYALPISCIAGLALLDYAGDPEKTAKYRAAAKTLVGTIVLELNDPQSGYIAINISTLAREADDRPYFGQAYATLFLIKARQQSWLFSAEELEKIDALLPKSLEYIGKKTYSVDDSDMAGEHKHEKLTLELRVLCAAYDAGLLTNQNGIEHRRAILLGLPQHTPARNIAEVTGMAATGKVGDEKTQALLGHFKDEIKGGKIFDLTTQQFANYYHLNASLAVELLDEPMRRKYYEGVERWYLANQKESGAWPALENVHAVKPTEIYTTAVACRVLQRQPAGPRRRQAQIDEAVRRGLDFLVATQDDDGLWRKAGYYVIPISCIAGLALLHRAEYADDPEPYRKAAYELAAALYGYADINTGRIVYPTEPTHGEDSKSAYDQAFAMLFLTQIYQSDIISDAEKEIVHRILAQSVGFIEQRQHPTGCWYQNYQNGHNQIPTTMHIYALVAAKQAGFPVDSQVLAAAREFNKRLLWSGSTPTYEASYTAAHLVGGWHENAELQKRARSVVETSREKKQFDLKTMQWANSCHLFTSTVCYYLGGEYWDKYYANVSAWYLANQLESGAWPALRTVHVVQPTETYTTAVACLILQMPRRALPMYKNIDSASIRQKLGLED